MKSRMVGVAFVAAVAGLFAAVAVAVPASAAPVTSAPAASSTAQVTPTTARDEDDCRVDVDRRRDSASAFCWGLDRGDEVTLKLRCERGWRGYVAEDSERVGRGDRGRVRLSVRCQRGFDAGRAWVEVDERGRGRG